MASKRNNSINSKLMLTLLGVGISLATFAQKFGNPKNIEEAIKIMDKYVPRELKRNIREVNDLDSLNVSITFFFEKAYPVSKWLESETATSLVNYYNGLGIYEKSNMEEIVLRTYQNHLRNLPLHHDLIYKPIAYKEAREREQEKVRYTTDTLATTYIPKDLEDCFTQINAFWKDSVKADVRQWEEDKFVGTTHHGFGTWLRNNWGLWRGSRLSKFFNELGIQHPDDMSGIILTSYHRYLNGKDIRLAEQIKYYKDYWEAVKKKDGN